jgi:hypothetical protein
VCYVRLELNVYVVKRISGLKILFIYLFIYLFIDRQQRLPSVGADIAYWERNSPSRCTPETEQKRRAAGRWEWSECLSEVKGIRRYRTLTCRYWISELVLTFRREVTTWKI